MLLVCCIIYDSQYDYQQCHYGYDHIYAKHHSLLMSAVKVPLSVENPQACGCPPPPYSFATGVQSMASSVA